MATASHPPFDASLGNALGASFETYRTNTSAALRLLLGQQQWREQLVKLEQRRIARDREAVEGLLESLRTARDWTDFAVATQSVWRDYLGASTTLWQEGMAAAMQSTSTWSESAREFTQQWQEACAGAQAGASKVPGALPMREWMNAFERAMSSAANGAAHPAKAAGSGHAQRASAGGGQHGH
ncbi:hypothetical protein [Paraburkholderia sp. J7]|uniref:hypothetical protein n=1 Tax=Paraburkholderia sp. J7 TaxID=2805438 RepID=UPI002AB5ECCC|nr:hypothetical protein [Paraburkholderia sp. J7]